MLRRLIREIGVFGECLCSLHLTLLIHLSPKSERHERLTAHTNTIASIQIILSIVSENHVNALMFNKNHLTISLTHRKIELLGFFICASQIDQFFFSLRGDSLQPPETQRETLLHLQSKLLRPLSHLGVSPVFLLFMFFVYSLVPFFMCALFIVRMGSPYV